MNEFHNTIVVEIPALAEHQGYDGNLVKIRISKQCPVCGGPRATKRVWRGLSYDGSRRLNVDCWENECGHVDTYKNVRSEGTQVPWSIPSITSPKFTTDRPTVTGWYLVKWETQDQPVKAWINVTPDGLTWGMNQSDDPEAVELDIDKPEEIQFCKI